MDILHLVDRLEELFNESRTLPFTRNAVVDEDKMLDIIDQMRVTIPEEVKKAQQVVSQRDRIIAQAQEEAARITALAREKAEQMVERETLVRSATIRADQILAQARADAQATRRDADDYVIEGLQHLEDEMSRLLNQVRNGLRKLEEERLHSPSPAPQPPGGTGAASAAPASSVEPEQPVE
ncbi:MAG: ATPase [Chloroflexi bacterium]|nr:MAG: ATPase [Chloroflexota bacterium]